MKKANKIFLFGIIGITVLMYASAFIGMRIENDIGVWIAVSACYFAMGGLIVSISGLLFALVSLLSSKGRQESLLFPSLSLFASLAFILGVFVIPIIITIQSHSGPEPWMTETNEMTNESQQSPAGDVLKAAPEE